MCPPFEVALQRQHVHARKDYRSVRWMWLWLHLVVTDHSPPQRARRHWRPVAESRRATGSWLAVRVVVASVSVASLLIAAIPVRAQEATPAATPAAAPECTLPLPADAPVSDGTGGTRLIPSATVTAVPSPAPSPIASPSAEARPGDAALASALEASASAIAGCLSDGNVDSTVALTSDDARGQLVSGGIPLTAAEFEALLPTLPAATYRILTVDEVVRQGEDEGSAAVTYTVANQVLAGTWQFVIRTVEGEDRWTLASIEPLPVEIPADASRVAVETRSGSYVLRGERVPGPTVSIDVVNRDAIEHEVLVLRLAEGVEPDVLLSQPGPNFPEGVTYVGDLIIPPDGTGTMLLTDLAPGQYTIVDLLPSAEGVPHLATGEVATFTVT